MVRRAFLRVRRKPWEDQLGGFISEGSEGERALCGVDWDVDSEEVAAVLESIRLRIGHVRVHNHYADKSGSFVEDLHMQTRWSFADAGVNESARLNVVAAEGDGDFGGHIEVGQDVRDDVHLGDALFLDFATVGAPGLVGEMAVDGSIHIPYDHTKLAYLESNRSRDFRKRRRSHHQNHLSRTN